MCVEFLMHAYNKTPGLQQHISLLLTSSTLLKFLTQQ